MMVSDGGFGLRSLVH